MKIHIVTSGANTLGGANRYTMQLVTRLAERGHEVSLFCFQCDEELESVCRVVRLPPYQVRGAAGTWRFSVIFRGRHCKQAFQRIDAGPADIVIASDTPMAWAYDQVFPNRCLIYIPHTLLSPVEVGSYQWASRIQRHSAVMTYKRLERWLLRRAWRTIRFTETSCDAVEQYYGKAITKFVVLPQAVDPPDPDTLERKFMQQNDSPLRVLFAGRLVRTKNVALALNAVRKASHGSMEFNIVGDGPDRQQLESQVRGLGLADTVKFHGHQEVIDDFYAQSDLFLFPSKLEYAPLVVLESMSHGVPVVAIQSDQIEYFNAHHEMIHSGVDSFLCRDETAFMDLVYNFAECKKTDVRQFYLQVHEVGKAARKRVLARHTWTSHVAQLESVLNSALRNQTNP